MAEGAPSLGSTATGHENNTILASNRRHNVAGHFTLCRVQPVAVYTGLRAQLTTIQKCRTKLFENRVKLAMLCKPQLEVRVIAEFNVQRSPSSQWSSTLNAQ